MGSIKSRFDSIAIQITVGDLVSKDAIWKLSDLIWQSYDLFDSDTESLWCPLTETVTDSIDHDNAAIRAKMKLSV